MAYPDVALELSQATGRRYCLVTLDRGAPLKQVRLPPVAFESSVTKVSTTNLHSSRSSRFSAIFWPSLSAGSY
jgi:hypothetical protein